MKEVSLPSFQDWSSFQIMGTFIYHGSSYFWRNVKDYASLHGNEVVCWKFLVILYRVLQDGQGNAIKDSLEEIPFIGESNNFPLLLIFLTVLPSFSWTRSYKANFGLNLIFLSNSTPKQLNSTDLFKLDLDSFYAGFSMLLRAA